MRKSFSIAFIVLLSLGLVCTRPFDIYADSSDGEFDNDSVVGVQVEEYEELLSGVQGTRYRFNIILDGFYVGNFNIHVEYDSFNVSTSNWDHFNIDRTVYVCGYDTYFETWMRENWLPPSSITWSASVNNSDQCIFVGRMESQQLLNLLISIRSTLNTYEPVMVSYLSSIDSKISDILKEITKKSIEPDSLSSFLYFFNSRYWDNGNYDIKYSLTNQNYFDLPYPFIKFENSGNGVNQLQAVGTLYPYSVENKPHEYYFVGWFMSTMNINDSNYSTYFYPSNNNFNLEMQKIIGSVSRFINDTNMYLALYKFKISPKDTLSSSGANCGLRMYDIFQDNGDIITYVSPIFSGTDVGVKMVSTDFALRYGFKNDLLSNLDIIANGTQESNNSSSNLEDINDDYDDVSQQVFGLENNFSTGFDSSMQNVPTTFNFGTQFGNKFLATATWVRNQFDTMTTNTPFGALITFSLVLGLALLIVGRRLL